MAVIREYRRVRAIRRRAMPHHSVGGGIEPVGTMISANASRPITARSDSPSWSVTSPAEGSAEVSPKALDAIEIAIRHASAVRIRPMRRPRMRRAARDMPMTSSRNVIGKPIV